MANAINWFEIPASNFDRAVEFYGKVFDSEIHLNDIQGIKMGFLPTGGDQEQAVGGAVIAGEGYVPSAEGALLYLNGGEDLNEPLARVEKAGGKVVLSKTQISEELGYFAIFFDSEGNRLAFHSPK